MHHTSPYSYRITRTQRRHTHTLRYSTHSWMALLFEYQAKVCSALFFNLPQYLEFLFQSIKAFLTHLCNNLGVKYVFSILSHFKNKLYKRSFKLSFLQTHVVFFFLFQIEIHEIFCQVSPKMPYPVSGWPFWLSKRKRSKFRFLRVLKALSFKAKNKLFLTEVTLFYNLKKPAMTMEAGSSAVESVSMKRLSST